MHRLTCTLVILLLGAVPPSFGISPKTVAEKVLLRLYQQAGRTDKPLPALSISKENKKVAAYYPARHQIVLDEKTYRLCRELGADSLNALAFILGHELAHSFQPGSGQQSTNFLVYGIQDSESNRWEKAADIQGAFTAYLAGYQIEEVLPLILEHIYKAYGLWGRSVPGYPSFEERSQSGKEVLAMSRRLISVFEAANYLTVLEYYGLAITCYAFLLNYYQGQDIYNNLGVLHVLKAQEYYNPSTDGFAHPLQQESLSLLHELDRQRGEESLTEAEKEKRRYLLERALFYFQQALKKDKGYLPAIGNTACAFNLMSRPEEALDFLNRHRFRFGSNGGAENLQMAYGVSCALKKVQREAENAFRQLLGSSNAFYALQAQYNLDALQGQAFSFSPPPPFQLPDAIVRRGRALERSAGSHQSLPLDSQNSITLSLSWKSNQSEMSFEDADGSIVTLLRWEGNGMPKVELAGVSTPLSLQFFNNVLPSSDGCYIRSDRDGLMLKANQHGEVEEVVRWVRHRRR